MTRTTTASCLAVVALLACGPPKGDATRDLGAEALRFARATCSARETCRCDDGRYDTRDDCEDDFVDRFMAQVESGASFDAECFDGLLASEAMTCAIWPFETFEYHGCAPLEGQGQVGDPCEWHIDLYPLYAKDCAGDLVCDAGRCAEALTDHSLSAGEPCHQGPVNTCATGLWCGADEVCHPNAALGSPCADARECEAGHYCAGLGESGVGTCSEGLGLGETCDPKDWAACHTPPLSWCGPAADGHACQEGERGICLLTFPLVP